MKNYDVRIQGQLDNASLNVTLVLTVGQARVIIYATEYDVLGRMCIWEAWLIPNFRLPLHLTLIPHQEQRQASRVISAMQLLYVKSVKQKQHCML